MKVAESACINQIMGQESVNHAMLVHGVIQWVVHHHLIARNVNKAPIRQQQVLQISIPVLHVRRELDLNAESESEIPNILKKQRQFDLILANPPYLPDPDAAETLFGGGGVLGDVVVLDIFRDVIPNYLSKKIGIFCVRN